GRHVVAGVRAATGGAQHVGGAFCQGARIVVQGSELLAVAERLLVVIADDLVEVPEAAGGCAGGPIGKPLVQLRAPLLRHSCVSRVANEDVSEAIRVLAPGTCREQVAARQAEQAAVDVRLVRVGGKSS